MLTLASLTTPCPACSAYNASVHRRRVFVVSDADLVSYRRKTRLASGLVATAVLAIASVLLIERFADEALWVADDAKRDCDVEWCYSRSALALWEWVLLIQEAFFCLALRHDLTPATGGVGVESFVL